MTEAMLFAALTVLNLAAAVLIIAGALSGDIKLQSPLHRAGLLLGSLGLAAQAVRNIQFLATGISPQDSDIPLWVLKDLGLVILAFTTSVYFTRSRKPR